MVMPQAVSSSSVGVAHNSFGYGAPSGGHQGQGSILAALGMGMASPTEANPDAVDANLMQAIVKQVEFYFSNSNLWYACCHVSGCGNLICSW